MKILIIEGCLINYGDDRGGQHEESSSIVDVSKDTARKLTETGRALYVAKSDDQNKDGRFTAGKEMLAAAEALAKSRTKAAAEGN